MTIMLDGKIARVTGGGNGIGREGARVPVAEHEADAARETVALFNSV